MPIAKNELKRIAEEQRRETEESRQKAAILRPQIEESKNFSKLISAGGDHTVGLRSDGKVVAVGSNGYGQCDVSHWTDIKVPTK